MMDEAAGRYIPQWREEFEHPQLDEWWRELCYQDKFHRIDIPVLHISGWYDDEQIGTPLNFAGMSTQAPSEWVHRAQRLIMGPWPHQVNTSTRIGDVDFGPNAVIDLRARELKFFDRWLKGVHNGEDEEPPVFIFVTGVNEWRSDQDWPLARTRYTPWYLHSGGCANSLFGDGFLSPEPPCTKTISETSDTESKSGVGVPEAESDTYVYDPRRPVPFITEPTSSQIGGPDDYTPIHRREMSLSIPVIR